MGPTVGRFSRVGVLESVDNADLKSAGETRAGSSPAADTKKTTGFGQSFFGVGLDAAGWFLNFFVQHLVFFVQKEYNVEKTSKGMSIWPERPPTSASAWTPT